MRVVRCAAASPVTVRSQAVDRSVVDRVGRCVAAVSVLVCMCAVQQPLPAIQSLPAFSHISSALLVRASPTALRLGGEAGGDLRTVLVTEGCIAYCRTGAVLKIQAAARQAKQSATPHQSINAARRALQADSGTGHARSNVGLLSAQRLTQPEPSIMYGRKSAALFCEAELCTSMMDSSWWGEGERGCEITAPAMRCTCTNRALIDGGRQR